MPRKARNILFVMYDQLRFDYLSCAGHKTLHTPNFDRLAAMGVRFTEAYVQSPVCGPSRMSFYTGRYVQSHGSSYNNFPLRVGEITLGDHLRKCGMGCWLVGKTHMKADLDGMDRLGISRDSVIGARVSECGFDIHTRDDGLWGEGRAGPYDAKPSPYREFLRAEGYGGGNPWHEHANSAIGPDDEMLSGWLMKNAGQPANISEPDSETPWLTDRAIEFIEAQSSEAPWLCHVSYIKPHWPYMAPAPYHDMYGVDDIQPVNRDARERQNPNPVFRAFQDGAIGRTFSRDEVRDTVVPAYMGLVRQCDDQFGRLLDYLEETGRIKDTVIVLTSDHGDYLGDHWLGEKDLFHQPSVKIPLIVHDPSSDADSTRGTTCDALVESIDLAPTFVEMAGGTPPAHILEGRSLLPFLHGQPAPGWRDYVISEYDYSATPVAGALGTAPRDARLFMVADRRWTFIHAEGGYGPMLFDRQEDPHEFVDLGDSDRHQAIITRMYQRLGQWSRRPSQRITRSDAQINAARGKARDVGIFMGLYDEDDLMPEHRTGLHGKTRRISP